jgi:hypothetical protein
MSTKRPSAIGLRKGLGTAASNQAHGPDLPDAHHDAHLLSSPPKPVRVTLNFPPDLFRHLDRWAHEAAETIGEPRVGVQDAARAMIHVIATGEAGRDAEVRALAQVSSQLGRRRQR